MDHSFNNTFFSSSSAPHQTGPLCQDLSTLFPLIIVVSSQSPAQVYWASLSFVLDACKGMTACRLYARGSIFTRLQCRALSALGDLVPGLDVAYKSGEVTNVLAAIDEILALVQSSLDTMVIPAPEQVQHQSAKLILILATRLPQLLLQNSQSVMNFINTIYPITSPLPIPVQETIFKAASLTLLASVQPIDPQQVLAPFSSFLSPLLAIFDAASQALASQQAMELQTLLNVRRAACILHALCNAYQNSPKRNKQVIYETLQPVLPSFLPCLSYALNQLGSSSGIASAAPALLNLLIGLLACFGKELGGSYINSIVTVFLELFDSEVFLSGLRAQFSVAADRQHRRSTSDSSLSHSISVFIVSSLLRLLSQIASERSTAQAGLISPISHLVIDRLLPLVHEAPAELMPRYLHLIHTILRENWRSFVVMDMTARMRRFTNPDMKGYFIRFMEVVLNCIRECTSPPGNQASIIETPREIRKLFAISFVFVGIGIG